jgi:hypothetical protein|uniref:Transmembrane protein n=1 Tax=Attheya septentrionalis TaxID=420275 RepID=A0A7S2UAU3_9STRA|mmetsp:Transcript_17784/g.32191  ORF Transcript_17784/g.32191 Transcript_17784/m.32191 type:complete len:165 (+) Transcript_17784:74-568(+)|eukprot:CAMPEP_0198294290 /NCGR_PEP_ID=MMETSP1449-20131203/21661_1 /TAXON_ID=420275 /ORGANISM="Attheya septentrionalis, Strain CCMP2084" /LENGTH=164 /DNA_ID=CAMNT_0043994199 /DNA_START=14 /DNA_END=508 /DNA_ORIENTATION=+
MNSVRYVSLVLGVALLILSGVNAFTCHTPATAAAGRRSLARNYHQRRGIATIVKNSEQEDTTTSATTDPQDTADTTRPITTSSTPPTSGVKESLEEKMKKWDATEEEIKKATLGGVVPGGRVDGFDIGLYIMFPIIVLTSVFFGIFPFIMDKIDVSSVGPPPMV